MESGNQYGIERAYALTGVSSGIRSCERYAMEGVAGLFGGAGA